MICEKEVVAIKCFLSPLESVQSEPQADHLSQNLLQASKLESEALRLKQDGNDLFRKKLLHLAIHKYTMAILQAPWGADHLREVAEECLETLLTDCPAKCAVAKRLHSTTERPSASQDVSMGKQSIPLLATCFGNRSAALFELGKTEECLMDIEHALHHGYVVASREDKLMRRREKCLARRRKSKKTNQDVQSSVDSGEGDDSSDLKLFSVFESELVTVQSHRTRGRYIQAARDLQPGDVIVSEEPYAAVLDSQFIHSHCSFCFKESLTLLPCCHCSSEGYCCSECRTEAWKRYHWVECPVNKLWKKADWMMQLCLRIVLRADASEILSALRDTSQQPVLSGAGYNSLHSLVAHNDKFTDKQQRLLLEKMSDTLTKSFGSVILSYLETLHAQTVNSKLPASHDYITASEIDVPSLTKLKQLFHHHLLQLRCNSHFISTEMVERTQESSETAKRNQGAVELTCEKQLGTVVYPTASLLNHSCAPNAIFRFVGNKVFVIVTEAVKARQEVNNSYGPQIGRMKRSERQEILRKKYFFDCNCEACSGTRPELCASEAVCDAFLCPACKSGPLWPWENLSSSCAHRFTQVKEDYHCLQCNCSLSSEQLSRIIEKRTQAKAMFKEATEGKMSIPLLLKCLRQQSEVLHRHNLELAKTNDALAQVYTMEGEFRSAVSHCQRSCETVGVVYGSNSVEVANEKEKLAQLLFHSGCYDLALKTAQEAKKLLRIYRRGHLIS